MVAKHRGKSAKTSFRNCVSRCYRRKRITSVWPTASRAVIGWIGGEDVYNPTKIQMEKVRELVTVDRKEFPKELHGTAWEGYNAVAKYTDWYREYRSEAKDARLRGVWFGTGADIKKRAWDFCTKEL